MRRNMCLNTETWYGHVSVLTFHKHFPGIPQQERVSEPRPNKHMTLTKTAHLQPTEDKSTECSKGLKLRRTEGVKMLWRTEGVKCYGKLKGLKN